MIRSEDPFTRINNGIFKDKRLNLKTLGLLCLCLSLPEDWKFSVRGLASICVDGPAAIVSALDSLEELGYLRRDRNQEHQENGKFGSVHYVFFDVPTAPCIDFPYTAEPYTENRAQEISKQETKKQEIPPKPPKGRREKSEPKYEPEMFERFWKAYPRGEDRQGAVREWDRLKPDLQLMHKMSTALDRQKATLSFPNEREHYAFPYAVRWLRNRRWGDDIGKAAAAAPRRDTSPSYEPEVSAWQ